jgi:hypothetical protein
LKQEDAKQQETKQEEEKQAEPKQEEKKKEKDTPDQLAGEKEIPPGEKNREEKQQQPEAKPAAKPEEKPAAAETRQRSTTPGERKTRKQKPPFYYTTGEYLYIQVYHRNTVSQIEEALFLKKKELYDYNSANKLRRLKAYS